MRVKTSSNRFKEEAVVELHKREIDWHFIVAFLLGTIFGEISADPLSDTIFFWRESTGIPMTHVEQVFYWYYLPAIVYASFFIISIMVMYYSKMSAKTYIYVIFVFAGVSLVFSLFILGFDPIIVLLLIVPLLSLVMFVFYEFVIKVKNKKIIV